jgi:methyl-accepting chemotaxis protein
MAASAQQSSVSTHQITASTGHLSHLATALHAVVATFSV